MDLNTLYSRLSDPSTNATEEARLERTLRPETLKDFIGQTNLKENLEISISAAKKRDEPLEHVLLYGNPGLGKTTLASIMAKEMNSALKITSGPSLEKVGDLAAILTGLEKGDVLFIDEIHRLHPALEEALYSAMEDFALDIVAGSGPGARTIRLSLAPFTLVGATTKLNSISAPLRDRFGHHFHLEFYTTDELKDIVKRSAMILGCSAEDPAAELVARRARRTPRIANRLLKRVRDVADVRHQGMISLPAAEEALSLLKIDELGLDETDRRVLSLIIEKFDGGPVGLTTLSHAAAEEIETIEDVIEPYLLQLGFLERTARGRMATRHAYAHLGKNPKKLL